MTGLPDATEKPLFDAVLASGELILGVGLCIKKHRTADALVCFAQGNGGYEQVEGTEAHPVDQNERALVRGGAALAGQALEAAQEQALRVEAFILGEPVQAFERSMEGAGQHRGEQVREVGQAQIEIEQLTVTTCAVGEGTEGLFGVGGKLARGGGVCYLVHRGSLCAVRLDLSDNTV